MKVKITLEGTLDEEGVKSPELYLNLLCHRLKTVAGGTESFDPKNVYWEREAVNGRTVSPQGEIICSD